MVASVNRGCSVIRSGAYAGARTELVDDGITRSPCIAMPDIHLALELKQVGRGFEMESLLARELSATQGIDRRGSSGTVRANDGRVCPCGCTVIVTVKNMVFEGMHNKYK